MDYVFMINLEILARLPFAWRVLLSHLKISPQPGCARPAQLKLEQRAAGAGLSEGEN